MFSKFFEFVGINNSEHFASVESFLKAYAGKSFLNGLYRLFRLSDISKWNEIVKKSFPQCVERINVFGFDWLGRIFAMDLDNNTVLLFEPGTGEVLDIPANFIDFHNVEIAKYHQESLASNFFYEWYEVNDNYILTYDKCAGYKIPLFLNGKDEVENLEISDMEVYWEIMMPLMNL